MSEQHEPHEHKGRMIFFTAAAAAGLGVAAITLARRHLNDGDRVQLEGVDADAVREIDSRFSVVEASATPIEADAVYIGNSDNDERLEKVTETYGIDLDDNHHLKERVVHIYREFRNKR